MKSQSNRALLLTALSHVRAVNIQDIQQQPALDTNQASMTDLWLHFDRDGFGQPEDQWHHVDLIKSGSGDSIFELRMAFDDQEINENTPPECEFRRWDAYAQEEVCDYDCQPNGGQWITNPLGVDICELTALECEYYMWDAEFQKRLCDQQCGPKGGVLSLNQTTNEQVCVFFEVVNSLTEDRESNLTEQEQDVPDPNQMTDQQEVVNDGSLQQEQQQQVEQDTNLEEANTIQNSIQEQSVEEQPQQDGDNNATPQTQDLSEETNQTIEQENSEEVECTFTHWDSVTQLEVCDTECQPNGGSWTFNEQTGFSECLFPSEQPQCDYPVTYGDSHTWCDTWCQPNGGRLQMNLDDPGVDPVSKQSVIGYCDWTEVGRQTEESKEEVCAFWTLNHKVVVKFCDWSCMHNGGLWKWSQELQQESCSWTLPDGQLIFDSRFFR